MTEYMEVDIIELPKIYELKETDKENGLMEWLYFLENPESEKVESIMKENEGIQEAKNKLEEISNDEIMQRLADWQESAEREETAIRNMAYREGEQKGKEVGRMEKEIEIAKKMKAKGMDTSIIVELTGLTVEQVEAIKQ